MISEKKSWAGKPLLGSDFRKFSLPKTCPQHGQYRGEKSFEIRIPSMHQCISISMLAEKLNMSPEEAERWIVNLIRNASLDAKIDSAQGHVVMGTQAAAVHQQVIERTKGLMYRTQMVSASIDKKLASQQKITYAEPFTVAWGAYDG